MKLDTILKDSNYKLNQLSEEKILEFKKSINVRTIKEKETNSAECLISKMKVTQ